MYKVPWKHKEKCNMLCLEKAIKDVDDVVFEECLKTKQGKQHEGHSVLVESYMERQRSTKSVLRDLGIWCTGEA